MIQKSGPENKDYLFEPGLQIESGSKVSGGVAVRRITSLGLGPLYALAKEVGIRISMGMKVSSHLLSSFILRYLPVETLLNLRT